MPNVPACLQERLELGKIHGIFRAADRQTPICLLTGPPGAGKTQIAADYARSRLATDHLIVGWTSAQTNDELIAGLSDIANKLGIADQYGDSTVSAKHLRTYLQNTNNDVLLVIDNAVDVEELLKYLPSVGQTQIIITSIHRTMAEIVIQIEVGPFSLSQSLSYLQARTNMETTEDSLAGEVAEDLGYLPVALAQAASMMRSQQIDYATYLTRLRGVRAQNMLVKRPGDPYPRGAAEAISLSIESLGKTDDSSDIANRILSIMSLLSPAGASRTLLQQLVDDSLSSTHTLDLLAKSLPVSSDSRLGRFIDRINRRKRYNTDIRIDEAIERLVSESVLNWDSTGSSVRLHRLTARVIRDREEEQGKSLTSLANLVKRLDSQFSGEHEVWKQREFNSEIVRHVLNIWKISLPFSDHEASHMRFAVCASAVTWSARFLIEIGDLTRAIDISSQLIADCNRFHREDAIEGLNARHVLALAYRSSGEFGKAVPIYEKISQAYEKNVGVDDSHTLTARNNLARAYADSGQPNKAITMFETVLDDLERVLGKSHRFTLSTRDNLAMAYVSAGQLAKGIHLSMRTLENRERIFGASDPDSLSSRNNLGAAFLTLGSYDIAISLFKTSLTELEGELGFSHPKTLSTRSNLAESYEASEDFAKAVPLRASVCNDLEREHGASDYRTLSARVALAYALAHSGCFNEAIPQLEEAVEHLDQKRGSNDPDVLLIRCSLADFYRAAGRFDIALPLLRTAASRIAAVLGVSNPNTLVARNNLAYGYIKTGRMDEAIHILTTVLASSRNILGEDHEFTLTVRRNLEEAEGNAGPSPGSACPPSSS